MVVPRIAPILELPSGGGGPPRAGGNRLREEAKTAPAGGAPPPGAPPAAKVLLRRLEPKADDMAQAMLGMMRREFVEHLDIVDVQRQLSAVRWIVGSFVACANENRPIGLVERERLVAIGADAMREGVSLPTLLGSVRLAARIGWLYAGEEAREIRPESLAVSALQEFGLLIFNFAIDLCDLVTVGYANSERLQARVRAEPAEALIDELLRGSVRAGDDLRRRARELGFDPDAVYGLVAVVGDARATDGHEILAAAETVVRQAPELGVALMLGGATPHAVVVVSLVSPSSWSLLVSRFEESTRDAPVRMLATAPIQTLLAIPPAYRRLRHLLRVAREANCEGIVWEADLAVPGLLGELGEEERHRFVEQVLGPVRALPDHRREPLLETLAAFLETGDVIAQAARRAHVHPKTVRYRLERIRDLTGLDPGDPEDRFRFELAIHILNLSTPDAVHG